MTLSRSARDARKRQKFTAVLLFQFRVDVAGVSSARRTCEMRYISYEARSKESAVAFAKRHGKRGEVVYKNAEGNRVHFEFIGVVDLLERGVECCEPDCEAIWYEIVDFYKPMERKNALLRSDIELLGRAGDSCGSRRLGRPGTISVLRRVCRSARLPRT